MNFGKSLLLFCICFIAGYQICGAAIIKVGPGEKVKSINEGIGMAQPHDTVLVLGGQYREGNIEIRKSLVLLGRDRPVIDGQKKHEPLSIYAPHVTVQGFLVKNSGRSSISDVGAIKIYHTHNVIIEDNILDDNFFGIYAQQAKNCVISNNQLTAYGGTELLTGNGIHAWKSDGLIISNNTIKGHRDGIYLEFVTATHSDNNQVIGNLRYGLHFMFSHDNSYTHNTFTGNGAGVAVMYTRNVRMEYNVFNENWGDAAYGLLLKDIMDSHIEHNIFVNNTTGIYIEGSNRVQIQHNRFEENGWALKIQGSSMDNTIFKNNFIHNTFDVATTGSSRTNKFEQNYWDKYEGYDLDKNNEGDIPYRPVSLYSIIGEKYPPAMLLFRSFMVMLLDRTERMIPSLTPENVKDNRPLMKPLDL